MSKVDLTSLLNSELSTLLKQAVEELRKSERSQKPVKTGETARIQAQVELLNRLALSGSGASVSDFPVVSARTLEVYPEDELTG